MEIGSRDLFAIINAYSILDQTKTSIPIEEIKKKSGNVEELKAILKECCMEGIDGKALHEACQYIVECSTLFTIINACGIFTQYAVGAQIGKIKTCHNIEELKAILKECCMEGIDGKALDEACSFILFLVKPEKNELSLEDYTKVVLPVMDNVIRNFINNYKVEKYCLKPRQVFRQEQLKKFLQEEQGGDIRSFIGIGVVIDDTLAGKVKEDLISYLKLFRDKYKELQQKQEKEKQEKEQEWNNSCKGALFSRINDYVLGPFMGRAKYFENPYRTDRHARVNPQLSQEMTKDDNNESKTVCCSLFGF